MFQSLPDYSDNSRAFSDYLIKNTDYKLLWSVTDPKKYKSTDRVAFIEKDGGKTLTGKLRFIYHTVSSEFLFSTHGGFLYANRKHQTFVCLWHGMPLKKIARLQDSSMNHYLNNARYILCTSSYYIPIFCKCFGKQENEIIPIGIPRNDLLFYESDVLDKLQLTINEGEKLIVYLPTFHSTDYYSDSKENIVKNTILDLSTDESIRNMNDFLRSINVKLVIKPHPAEANKLSKSIYSNIFIIPHAEFDEKDIQLNSLLHYADALLTDFSGVFIDYLLLDRPIGFALSDVANYTTSRGFLFDNPLDYMPGMKIYNNQDFRCFCKDVAEGNDRYSQDRVRLKNVYNDHFDSNNCKRLVDFLKLK